MSISKVQSQGESREILTQMEALRKRAARQAKASAAASDIPTVECVVLPKGNDLISMGEHFGPYGDACYEEGETFDAQVPIAVSLYDKGYVNFEGARQASLDAAEARSNAIRARREAERRAREDAEAAE